MQSATVFFALAALTSASAVAIGPAAVGITADVYARPAYKTSYAVSDKLTGDQKSAVEIRDGDITKGSYSLLQPDGVIRTVNYIVTPLGGFQAQVLNNGVAVNPERAVVAAAAPVAISAPIPRVAAPAIIASPYAYAPAVAAGTPLNIGINHLGGARSVVTTTLLGLNGGLAGAPGLGWGR